MADEPSWTKDLIRAADPFIIGRRRDGVILLDYIDGHRFLANPRILTELAARLAAAAAACGAATVAGEVSAGSALAVAVAMSTATWQLPLQACGIRKVAKTYGIPGHLTTSAVCGPFFLVDDVAGTGHSLVRCTHTLRGAGHEVVGASVVIDREQGAAQAMAALGIPFTPLITLSAVKSSARTSEMTQTARSPPDVGSPLRTATLIDLSSTRRRGSQ